MTPIGFCEPSIAAGFSGGGPGERGNEFVDSSGVLNGRHRFISMIDKCVDEFR
jgi:hypothetical protein